jgi:hypothetical protein
MDDSAPQRESRRLEQLYTAYEAGYLYLCNRLDSRADSKYPKKPLFIVFVMGVKYAINSECGRAS